MEKNGFNATHDVAYAATTSCHTKNKGTSNKVYMQLTGLKGKVYLVEEGALSKLQMLSEETTPSRFVGLVTDNLSLAPTTCDTK